MMIPGPYTARQRYNYRLQIITAPENYTFQQKHQMAMDHLYAQSLAVGDLDFKMIRPPAWAAQPAAPARAPSLTLRRVLPNFTPKQPLPTNKTPQLKSAMRKDYWPRSPKKVLFHMTAQVAYYKPEFAAPEPKPIQPIKKMEFRPPAKMNVAAFSAYLARTLPK